MPQISQAFRTLSMILARRIASLLTPSRSMIGIRSWALVETDFSRRLCCGWMNIRGIFATPASTIPLHKVWYHQKLLFHCSSHFAIRFLPQLGSH
ncbi:unnamed protein product, partial [Vitis vinifera]|uniref:Uncharacterized protein n=1 Tax=Vitis vinifera TaxID=29760 RepID=D7TRY6_VITVI